MVETLLRDRLSNGQTDCQYRNYKKTQEDLLSLEDL